MKFGIFHELATPRPFTPEAETQVVMNALEQVRLADELGFTTVWAVEHHFLEGYSHCSAPEVFLTACAMQTKNIRVGHGAVVCVPEMNHPIRVAERAAMLDIVSGGRLEFGTARSSTWRLDGRSSCGKMSAPQRAEAHRVPGQGFGILLNNPGIQIWILCLKSFMGIF